MPGRVLDNYPAFWELKIRFYMNRNGKPRARAGTASAMVSPIAKRKNSGVLSPPSRTEKSATQTGKDEKEMK